MCSFERTVEDKRKSGDYQEYGIGHSRNALDACFEGRFIAAKCFHKWRRSCLYWFERRGLMRQVLPR
jgi:hypothetical protein